MMSIVIWFAAWVVLTLGFVAISAFTTTLGVGWVGFLMVVAAMLATTITVLTSKRRVPR